MSPLPSRPSVFETLQRVTSRLADTSLTIGEANQLLPLVQRLVEELDAERRDVMTSEGRYAIEMGKPAGGEQRLAGTSLLKPAASPWLIATASP